MRVENVDFDTGTIFTPDSKTEFGRRFIPMSSRLKADSRGALCGTERELGPDVALYGKAHQGRMV